MHYQPIVDLATARGRRIRGADALAPPRARLRAAERVHPARRAERPHPGARRTSRCARPSARPASGTATRRDRGPTSRSTSRRTSSTTPTSSRSIRTSWRERISTPSRLVLEITESVALSDVAETLTRHQAPRATGRGHRAGRLRHGLLVALVPREHQSADHQDRPVLRAAAPREPAQRHSSSRRSSRWVRSWT